MSSKVYTGATSIKEHIKQLGELYQRDPSSIQYTKPLHVMGEQTTEYEGPVDGPLAPRRKQSIEVQRLKRESGLCED